jgi:hypothetical protein
MFSTRTAGCSLGFNPSKVCYRRPGSGFRPISSHTLLRTDSRPPAGVSEFQSAFASASSDLTASRNDEDETTLIGFSHPTRPRHSSKTPSGLCVHLAQHHTLLCATTLFGWIFCSTGVARTNLGAEHRDLNVAKTTVRLMLVRPFRVFGFAARTSVSPPWFVLPGLAARSELSPAQVSPLWVRRSHCAVSPFLRLCGLPCADYADHR